MASDITLGKEIIKIESVNTNVNGNLRVIGNFFPTRMEVIDHRGRNKVHIAGNGTVRTSNELKIPLKTYMRQDYDQLTRPSVKSTDELSKYDSVARNMRWLLERIEVLEKKLGITEPTAFPKDSGV